eukprot:COSAG02_NODE_1040_length_15035_cov_198.613819_1_plen_112_part_00
MTRGRMTRGRTALASGLSALGRLGGLALLLGAVVAIDDSLELQLAADGQYSLKLGGSLWLRSAPTILRTNGQNFSTGDGTLVPVKNRTTDGEDAIGMFSSTTFTYTAAGKT